MSMFAYIKLVGYIDCNEFLSGYPLKPRYIELSYLLKKTAVRMVYGTIKLFKTGKRACQSCKLSLLLNIYAEYIMRNVLEVLEIGIQIIGGNSNLIMLVIILQCLEACKI